MLGSVAVSRRYPPPSKEQADIGARMRLVRSEYRISRRLLGDYLSISSNQLNRVERGVVSLRLGPGWDFCELTKTDPRWLAFGHPYHRVAIGNFGTIPTEQRSLLFLSGIKLMQDGARIRVPKDRHATFEKNRVKIKMLADSGIKQYLSRMPATGYLLPSWEELRQWLVEATSEPGAKAALARHFNVKPAAVSQWLSGATAPTASTTLRLLKWVTGSDVQQQKNAPEVKKARPALTTRTRRSQP